VTEQQTTALKEIFDRARIRKFANDTKTVWAGFDDERFFALATDNLDDLGIMQRMRRVAEAFDATLPDEYAQALSILADLAPMIQHGFASITLCEFVVIRGMSDFDRSMQALHLFTRYGSAEFAIRHFLKADPQRTLMVMREWSADENEHVRRLASEGCRPRLPWSFQFRDAVADPSLTMPILEALRADPSLYVRKSVANHLNDISKDHSDWLVTQLSAWPRGDERTEWIIKQALRTLVKNGHEGALALVGVTGQAEATVGTFSVAPASLKLGDRVSISVAVISTAAERQKIVADYAIHYVKKNGAASRKVFKLKTFTLEPNASQPLSISQSIRDFTTRTHNAGFHKVELLLNGQSVAEGGFELIV
jgi:3-methyladenine DNA glycosylase AlkC